MPAVPSPPSPRPPGRSISEFATPLGLSTSTASVHVSTIARTLDVATRCQAAETAERYLVG